MAKGNEYQSFTKDELVEHLDHLASMNAYYLQDDDTYDYRQNNNKMLQDTYNETVTYAKENFSPEDFDGFVGDATTLLDGPGYDDTNVSSRAFIDVVNKIDPDYASRFEASQRLAVNMSDRVGMSGSRVEDDFDADVLKSDDDLGFAFDDSGNPVEAATSVIVIDPKDVVDVDYVDVKPDKDNNMVDYDGPLGKFKYDKTQFTVDTYEIEAEDFPETGDHFDALSVPRLHYIGAETDGNKIKIPDGIKSGDFMFAGSNIKNTPRLPKSLESTYSMFQDCKQLKTAISEIPKNVGNTSYMYSGCSNLKYGPRLIPANVKNMDGMFGECSKLVKPPYICDGVESTSFAFFDCSSLYGALKMPKSVTSAYGMYANTHYESADNCYVAQDVYSDDFKRFQEMKNNQNTSQNGSIYQDLKPKSSKDMIAEMFKIKFLQMHQKCSECLSRGVTYGKELAVKAKDKTVELAKAGATKVKTTYNEKVQPKVSEMASNVRTKAGATVQNTATGFADKVKTGTHDFVQTRYDKFMEKNAGAASVNRGAQAESKFGGISPDLSDASTEFDK